MASFNKFNATVAHFANGIHNLGLDTFMVALSSVAPVAGNSVLADITEISYTNLSSRVLTVTSSSQTGGIEKWLVQQLTLTASGAVAAFRYVTIYNNTAASKNLIGWYDYGSTINMLNGETLLIGLDTTNGVLTIQ